MRLHLASQPEPTLLVEFARQTGLGGMVTVGDEPPGETTVLVAGRVSGEQLSVLPELEAVVIPFAGLVPATREALLTRPEVAVYNLHHNAAATAEKALELLFAVAKRTVAHDRSMRVGKWSPRFEDSSALQLEGRSVVILGFGSIGQRVARACGALGMKVSAVSRGGSSEFEGVEVFAAPEFAKVAHGTDVLVCCAPLTDETSGKINDDVLRSLAPDAIIVNVGRGPIIDEKALFGALCERRLHGAGLDVWWAYPKADEPCEPSQFPFQDLDNVVMSPHIGGSVKDTEPARYAALAELVNRIKSGDPSLRRVDVRIGY